MTSPKVLPIAVPPELYAILERKAQAEDRDCVQQARYLLKEALRAEALRAEAQVAPAAAPAESA